MLLQLRLAELERGAVNDMFVILSDVWLDNKEVITRPIPPFLAYQLIDVCFGF